ncbi:tyrosine-type recombinase/integrase [Microbacterium imperiale]|uniref:Site-specific integrase n=1 Tax=Microbacterium imperiale TaxID=33884 RepID=A0A9W6HE97_9MICO|nr:tyrosine-type recombinase/integrase [Microbacterium imperiale]MBP2419659.1 integrase [Microbacterium imperiale]MDS0198475.1 site-specific integrase [Microbacterium imperiale]BFE40000.1 site-specific integrase [Microbacterium imperiale]GLJ79025.1 site-specific integrase [Microbacterium imperiale]
MASIKQRPDGVWRARYRDADGKEHARHFKLKREAQTWLDEVTTSVVTGMYVDPGRGKILLGAYFDEWAARKDWTSSTHRQMRLVVDDCGMRERRLDSIKRADVEKYMRAMVDRQLAPRTIKTRLMHLGAILNGAVSDKRIAANPAAGVKGPALSRNRSTVAGAPQAHGPVFPEGRDVRALLSAADGTPFAIAVAIAAFAGLRLGEICGLTLADIDSDGGVIRVRRQVQRNASLSKAIEIRPPKYGSARDVLIPPELVARIGVHVAQHGTHGEADWLLPGRILPDGLVDIAYPIPAGGLGPMWPRAFEAEWTRTRAAAGVDTKFHNLRHYAAGGMINAGCDVVTVQRQLGHKDPSLTLDIYAAQFRGPDSRARTALSKLISETLADSSRTGSPSRQ